VTFTPDGKRLISTAGDGTILVWDRDSGQELLTLPAHVGAANAVAIDPVGRLIISAGGDGNVIFWYGP
jgi:WD40 repeat protein